MNILKTPLFIACISVCCISLANTTHNKANLKVQQKQIPARLNVSNFQFNSQNRVSFDKNCPQTIQQYIFTSQKDIDNFPSKCKSVPQIYINGDDITNIDGLKNIRNVMNYSGNQISIFIGGGSESNNLSLQKLVGLNKLKKVNGDIDIYQNGSLKSIDAFQKLKKINGEFIISGNTTLTSIKALPSVSKLATLDIEGNRNLTTIDGQFSSLKVLTKDLSIKYNDLSTLSSLNSLTSVGLLDLSYNSGLTNLDGLQNIKELTRAKSKIYNAYFENQPSLEDCSQISKLYHATPSRFYFLNLTPDCQNTLTNWYK